MSVPGSKFTPGALGFGAAPTGGPDIRGWGCALFPRLSSVALLRSVALVCACALAAPACAQIEPPSGLPIRFHDRIEDVDAGGAPLWRYRYVLPGLGGEGRDFMSLAEDMTYLCDHHALPELPDAPARVVVTLMERPVTFGEITPGVVQFFESYRVENGMCIWEAF